MANIVLANQYLLKSATITSGTFDAATAPANLASAEPSEKLTLTSSGAAYVEIDLGTAAAIRCLAALYVEKPTGLTWRWRGATSQANLTASPGYDTTELDFADNNVGLPHRDSLLHDFLWLDAAETFQWWRLDFNDACSIGNLIVAPGWQPECNYAYGAKPPVLYDPSVIKMSSCGRAVVTTKPMFDIASFSFDFMSPADALANARDFDEQVGARDPALIIFDPEATTYKQQLTLFGRLRPERDLVNSFFNIYSKTYSVFAEMLP